MFDGQRMVRRCIGVVKAPLPQVAVLGSSGKETGLPGTVRTYSAIRHKGYYVKRLSLTGDQ